MRAMVGMIYADAHRVSEGDLDTPPPLPGALPCAGNAESDTADPEVALLRQATLDESYWCVAKVTKDSAMIAGMRGPAWDSMWHS